MEIEHIVTCAEIACLLEVGSYPKPGNVSPYFSLPKLTYAHFLRAAFAIEEGVRRAAKGEGGIGENMLRAIKDTNKVAKGNVNMGIVLLLIPLARAAAASRNREDLRRNLYRVIAASTPQDSINFLRAVRISKPFLSPHTLDAMSKKTEKLIKKRKITFKKLMEISKGDEVAEELTNGCAKTFEASAFLEQTFAREKNLELSIAQTFLFLLSKYPDTFIAKKLGEEKAKEVSEKARGILEKGGVFSKEGYEEAVEFDRELRMRGERYTPGSTADITCGAVFISLLFGALLH